MRRKQHNPGEFRYPPLHGLDGMANASVYAAVICRPFLLYFSFSIFQFFHLQGSFRPKNHNI
jgi:hypothetical protein